MLEQVYIKNFALIQEATLTLHQSLNILSGETGAGKSILIDSISFALGERSSKDILRTGETEGVVELFFSEVNEDVLQYVRQIGVEIEDNSLLLSRTLHHMGKSQCRINGRVVTQAMLKDLGKLLMDIHGQHEHQSLLNSSKHIDYIDRLGGEQLAKAKEKVVELYSRYKQIQEELQMLGSNDKEKARQVDIISYQIEEIKNANLQTNEEEILDQKRKLYLNMDKQFTAANEVHQLLTEDFDTQKSLLQLMHTISKRLNDVAHIDNSMENTQKTFDEAYYLIQDISYEMREYKDTLQYDPEDLYVVERRLDLIYSLKRKYGSTIQEILEFKEKMEDELHRLENCEVLIEKLQVQLQEITVELEKACTNLSQLRSVTADFLKENILLHLEDLDMKSTSFEVSIKRREQFTSNGFDDLEFMISTNPGEPLKPLAKIASGGEISRIMLAMKSVLSQIDEIQTLIFDEIDTGISGKAAQKVGEKIKRLSKQYQILCITHLPQIASMSDDHFYIEKEFGASVTTTRIKNLQKQEVIHEIARMIGGAAITKNTLKSAEEMIMMAQNL